MKGALHKLHAHTVDVSLTLVLAQEFHKQAKIAKLTVAKLQQFSTAKGIRGFKKTLKKDALVDLVQTHLDKA